MVPSFILIPNVKPMYKIISLNLFFALLILVVSCVDKEESTSNDNSSTNPTDSAQKAKELEETIETLILLK